MKVPTSLASDRDMKPSGDRRMSEVLREYFSAEASECWAVSNACAGRFADVRVGPALVKDGLRALAVAIASDDTPTQSSPLRFILHRPNATRRLDVMHGRLPIAADVI